MPSPCCRRSPPRHGKDLRYNIPVELGGFSIFFPLLLSLITEFKTVDADGAGRAVPALETLLLHVNGCPTSPIALANGVNDKITVELADSHNAPLAEKIGRDICGEFGNMVGISGWLVDKTDIENRIITGSITQCEKIGAIMRRANCPAEKLFEMLASEKLVQSKVVCVGDVTDIRVRPTVALTMAHWMSPTAPQLPGQFPERESAAAEKDGCRL